MKNTQNIINNKPINIKQFVLSIIITTSCSKEYRVGTVDIDQSEPRINNRFINFIYFDNSLNIKNTTYLRWPTDSHPSTYLALFPIGKSNFFFYLFITTPKF